MSRRMLHKKSENIIEVLNVLKILSHPVRLRILCHLIEYGEMSAGEIVKAEEASASQSQISQYLQILKKQGIIKNRKDGLFQHYSLAEPNIKKIITLLHALYCK